MNTIVTSRDAILEISQKMAFESGLPSLNIREVAARCGVSVGSVYNYFPSKADLIAATIEKGWQGIFHQASPDAQPKDFAECAAWLFASIQKASLEYPSFFTFHAMSFAAPDKEKRRETMNHYFLHMKSGLLHALEHDARVRADAFGEHFTQADLIDFVFNSILSLSMQRSKSCDTLTELIRRAIY